MAKAKRVFEVAKELGVESKAIVAKCQAEGVPGITNHMSTVKLGLVETIRQWFGDKQEADASTAVEVAEKVDLKRVRRRATPVGASKGSDAAETEDSAGDAETTVATAEQKQGDAQEPAPEEPAQPEQPTEAAEPAPATVEAEAEAAPVAAASTETTQEAAAPAMTATTEEVAPAVAERAEVRAESRSEGRAAARQEPREPAREVAAKEKAPEAAKPAPAPAAVRPVGEVNVPDRPAVVMPVGEKLGRPQEARLRGPKIVRVEQPDVIQQPRARRGPPDQDRGAAPAGSVPGITRSRGPARGRGAGAAGMGTEDADRSPARNKRRSLTSRRGRFAQALPSGPGKISEQDLLELDARLKRSTGFVKQRRRDMRKRDGGSAAQTPAVTGGVVEIAEPIFIKDLSAVTGIKTSDIIKYLFKKGVMSTINSAIDAEAAMEICLEYNIELAVKEKQTAEQKIIAEFEGQEQIDVQPRPPVVAVLGHVDHGKTSLLDRIRATDVAAHEAGGITQHVGASRITIKGTDGEDKTVVFLDTPGHEAFTSMRARGAHLTDLVVLVVAADDGVMPQTIESINHAKAAGVPIIVAMNKIDLAGATEANVRKIYGQLAEHGLNPVEWGGETEVIKVSAHTGEGITDLMEILDYQAELLELVADQGGRARGSVIEAEMQEGRGPVARVLVQQGQMKVGDFIVIGRAFGRVRDMTDERGKMIPVAGPATPLELSGIDVVPDAGVKFYVTESLQKAEQIAQQYRDQERTEQLAQQTKVTLANFADQLKAGKTKELRVVLKADVQGSIDVLRKSLSEIGNEEVSVRVLHGAVGGVTESDVLLADASDAVIVGFHVVATPAVRDIAEARGVDIQLYRVIYDLINDVKASLEGLLEPEIREQILGQAEVRQVFKVSKLGTVAGCLVTDGLVQRAAKVRLERNGVIVTADRTIETLRRIKDDVREVRQGTECGIRIQGFDDVKEGDTITCYQTLEVKRKLD